MRRTPACPGGRAGVSGVGASGDGDASATGGVASPPGRAAARERCQSAHPTMPRARAATTAAPPRAHWTRHARTRARTPRRLRPSRRVADRGLGGQGAVRLGRRHQDRRGRGRLLGRAEGRQQDRRLVARRRWNGRRREDEGRRRLAGRRRVHEDQRLLLLVRSRHGGRRHVRYRDRALVGDRHLQADRLLGPEAGEPGAQAVLEVLDERARRLVAVLRLLGEDLVEHLAPLLRHEAVHLEVRGLDRVDVDELVEDRGDVRPREGLLPREHLEGDDAEREDVAPAVELLPHRLLGGHVGRGAEQRPGVRDLGVGELGDAEVGDLDLVRLVDDEVGGLDVPVDDPARVGVVEGRRDLAHEADHPLGLEAGPFLEDGADRLPLHELHGEERHLVLLADVEQGDDVGVGQRPRDPRLLVEALLERPVLRAPRGDVEADRLDRQGALDEGVEGLVDGPHGAEAEGARDLVAADRGRDFAGGLPLLVAHRSAGLDRCRHSPVAERL